MARVKLAKKYFEEHMHRLRCKNGYQSRTAEHTDPVTASHDADSYFCCACCLSFNPKSDGRRDRDRAGQSESGSESPVTEPLAYDRPAGVQRLTVITLRLAVTGVDSPGETEGRAVWAAAARPQASLGLPPTLTVRPARPGVTVPETQAPGHGRYCHGNGRTHGGGDSEMPVKSLCCMIRVARRCSSHGLKNIWC
jgi:hypothetical protein